MYNLSKEKIKVSLKKSEAYSKYLKISLFALGITLGLLIILNIIAFILYGDTRINVVIHGVEILTHNFNKISNSFRIEKTVSDLGECGYNIDIAKDKIPSTVTVTCFD